MRKPDVTEYPDYYGNKYIALVPEGDILKLMEKQSIDTVNLLEDIGEEKGSYRYGEGKWSIKEVIGHLNDEERLFGYQIFRISRGDRSSLPGINENEYVIKGKFDNRSLKSISDEFKFLRSSNIEMITGLDEEMLLIQGTADGHKLTVRTIPYVMVGHVIHHTNVIKERYLHP